MFSTKFHKAHLTSYWHAKGMVFHNTQRCYNWVETYAVLKSEVILRTIHLAPRTAKILLVYLMLMKIEGTSFIQKQALACKMHNISSVMILKSKEAHSEKLLFENEIEHYNKNDIKIERKSEYEESLLNSEDSYDPIDENDCRIKKSKDDKSCNGMGVHN